MQFVVFVYIALFILQATTISDHVVSASWSEHGIVYIYDVTTHLGVLDTPDKIEEFEVSGSQVSPLFAFDGHQIEGYALAWSRNDAGKHLSQLLLRVMFSCSSGGLFWNKQR